MPELIITKDGSHSLLNEALNETYHSTHGAIQESKYVFIAKGLEHYHGAHPNTAVKIFEVGFGTGLNALLALQFSIEKNIPVDYITLEAFPLEPAIWSRLNYPDALGLKDVFVQLHEAPWEKISQLSPTFRLKKEKTTLQEKPIVAGSYDVVFFDAFAPGKQPEMWTLDVLSKVVAGLTPGGIFVTYCAKGQLKRDLKGLGLIVETLPGPPGKKEMVRATLAL